MNKINFIIQNYKKKTTINVCIKIFIFQAMTDNFINYLKV